MGILVQKFGGTSVASVEKMKEVCNIIENYRKKGNDLVIVVSAMGRKGDPYATDTLINLCTNVNQKPKKRELDLIMSCGEVISGTILSSMLEGRGIPSVFLTGTQAGIITTKIYSNSKIKEINPTRIQRELDEVLLTTRENLTGVRVIRAFRTQKLERETFEHKSDVLMAIQMHVGKISASLNPLTYIIVNAGIIAVIWFGGIQVNVGDMTQGEVIALVNYMTQTLLALVALANLIITFTKALASAGRINEVFAMKPGIVDGNEKESAVQQTEEPKTAVSMEDVTFYYQKSKEPALEHISFTAKKGETIGIIGGTGSGKSTLVSLIPRFYDVTEGRVFVNGKDVREYKVENLRSKVGMVPQKAVLFHGTIRDNMKMGREDASDEEIFEALKTAQALEIVENKPGKLDTVLSEGGKNLSGGQRQRLTIARALVRNPEVLILDDSASALDFATDANLRKAIAEDTNNMTVFIVSQRAASIMHADKIIVLDDGQMVGYGTHQELLKQCEVYQEICYSQFSKEEVQDHE